MPKRREFDETTLRELWSDTSKSQRQIASLLGMPRATLQKIAARLKLPQRFYTGEQETIDSDEFLRLWHEGKMGVKAIARHMGCPYQRVNRLRRRLGLGPREPTKSRRGDNTKVFDPTPEEIAMRAAAIKAKRLAEKRRDEHFPMERPANIRNFTHCNDCFQPASLLS